MDALNVIPPVMIGFVFQFIYSLYVNVEQYHKKQGVIAIGTIIAAGTNIILNWICIRKYGYIASAYTTLISYIVLFFVHFMFVRHLKKSYVYDTRFNLCFLSMALGFLVVLDILYKVNWLRLFLIFVLAMTAVGVLFKYHNMIIKTIKTKSLTPLLALVDDLFGD